MFQKFLSLILILLFSPLFLLIAALILVEDGFPIFFNQKRIGINYTFFSIHKFRSMKKDTPNLATHLLENPNKYILKSGRIIRKLSLDELPNLINIFKGEMLFVGPRPALYNQEDLMELRIKNGVDKIKPGITGWAQINGRDELSITVKVRFEKEYLVRKSFFFDLKIIWLTISKIISTKGVNH